MKQAKFGSPNRLTEKKADFNRAQIYTVYAPWAFYKGQIKLSILPCSPFIYTVYAPWAFYKGQIKLSILPCPNLYRLCALGVLLMAII